MTTVLTSITGGKDRLREDFDFTDGKFIAFVQGAISDNWEIRKPCDRFKDPVRNAKIHKILAHKYADTPYSIWVDGNISFNVPPSQLVDQFLGDGDIWLMTHFCEDNDAYWEGIRCHSLDNEPNAVIDQLERYRIEGFPEGQQIYECNVIIRKHSEKMEMFNDLWWAEISAGARRDQIATTYCFWKMERMGMKLDVRTMEGNVRTHPYFDYRKHQR